MVNPDLIIESATRVKQLREDLKQAEADFNRLLASNSGTTRTRPAPKPRTRPVAQAQKQTGTKGRSLSRKNSQHQSANPQAPTMTDNILKTLEAAPKQTFSPPQLADRLAIKNINSLTSTLMRLAQNRRIRKVGSGVYAAKEPAAEKTQKPASPAPKT
jgi:hypothetical protein